MELRHLRCLLVVAEELHLAPAVDKLHMDQSPLSRTIRELGEDLGEQLFVRTSRSTVSNRRTRLDERRAGQCEAGAAVQRCGRSSLKLSRFHGRLSA
ncbi:LysR family transcriptional regulator [Paracidovorax citrulli]|uniref:LysR family transcriptional regulator n=1 Tax=Paracidovorax citrulli TaxID=80869 RepID=A0ABY9ANE6_PARCI|nr:LysR family transcriptional regulator [Paracidovorax citrulli]ATG95569.1 hypothetical protein CQB05_17305 [Paracidovorax citrulli]MVT29495.1 LysR family transcriptional regulator [Paracidovorax citrulli]MVT38046.1 LysR family transcriptional regulator [Paracidovorax citrulli]UMT84971.1 LysR family transcriptional regulator [Paracidovorax citrulli]WIY28790.1 LysR family transcriptional regulator [Paracidovorax citrulli]